MNERKKSIIKGIIISVIIIIIGIPVAIEIINNQSKVPDNKTGKNITETTTTKTISYKCPNEYELINNKCYKIIDTTNVNIEYSCKDGYTLENNKCIKIEYSDNYVVDWVCPDGYTMGEKKYPDLCYKKTIIPTITKYTCKYGYTLENNKCIKTETISPTPTYVCENGGIYNQSDGLCHLMALVKACTGIWRIDYGNKTTGYRCVANPYLFYDCPTDTIKSGNICIKTEELDAELKNVCPSDKNYTINEERTECTFTEATTPSYIIRCGTEGYTFKDNYCTKTTTIKANKRTYCNDGYDYKDNKCRKYDIQDLIESYD